MSRVYWDSMLFIYWLENNLTFAPMVERLFQAHSKRSDQLCTSIFTVGEVLVGPIRQNDARLASKIEQFFDSGFVELLPVNREAVGLFANLRAVERLAPADALHLACAGTANIDLFLTNDKKLHRHQVPGIHFIAGLDVKLI